MPRSKQFDPDEALAKAMGVFWTQGYEATSMQDLVDAMGINRFSLYEEFGDKHSLYLAALDSYMASVSGVGLEALEAAEDGASAIRRYFADQVERMAGEGDGVGCMLVNCSAELASRDEEAADRVRGGMDKSERAFRSALGRAVAAGDVDPDRDLDDLARFFAASSSGMAVVAKAKPGRAFLESFRRVIVSALDGPR